MKKSFLPLTLTFMSIIGFGAIGYYSFSRFSTPLGINEITSSGTTTLEASPAPAGQFLGQEFTLDINAHSGTDRVTAVQLELTYDPVNVQINGFTKTDYLPNYLVTPVIGGGKVTATLASPLDSGGRPDWGTVSKIVIKPLALGVQTINFGAGTLVSATSSSSNVLKAATPIVITVYNLGDIDRSKKIDLFDYNIFVTEYGKTGYSSADLNQSNKVDIFDYNLLVTNYGKTSP